MYSALQHQCLNELGIPLYQLKESILETSKSSVNFDWTQVEQSWLADLRVIFPSLSVGESGLLLDDSLVWTVKSEGEIKLLDRELITASPDVLTVSDKRKIWQLLSHHVSADESM